MARCPMRLISHGLNECACKAAVPLGYSVTQFKASSFVEATDLDRP